MEALKLVVREGNTDDRRTYAVEIGKVGRQHNDALFASITTEERETLSHLLQKIADQRGLTRGVHSGFSRLGEKAAVSGPSHAIEPKQAR